MGLFYLAANHIKFTYELEQLIEDAVKRPDMLTQSRIQELTATEFAIYLQKLDQIKKMNKGD